MGVGLSDMIRSRSFEAVHAWQSDIHGDDVRTNGVLGSRIEKAQRFFRACHRADYLEPRIPADYVFEKLPNHARVLDNQHAYLLFPFGLRCS